MSDKKMLVDETFTDSIPRTHFCSSPPKQTVLQKNIIWGSQGESSPPTHWTDWPISWRADGSSMGPKTKLACRPEQSEIPSGKSSTLLWDSKLFPWQEKVFVAESQWPNFSRTSFLFLGKAIALREKVSLPVGKMPKVPNGVFDS